MKKLLTMTAALMLLSTQLYAGNGDLIVGGNLGVGTNNPQAPLHVIGTKGVRLEGLYKLGFMHSVNSIHISQNTDWDGLTWKMIDDGKAAIFQTYLAGDEAFRVSADDTLRTAGSDAGLTPLMIVKTSGNVGIGTTAPQAPLHITGIKGLRLESISKYGFMHSVNNIHISQNTDWDGSTWKMIEDGKAAIFQTHLSGGEAFRVSADDTSRTAGSGAAFNPLMIVKTNGNVGIGTTDPQGYKLYVAGPAYSTGGWQSSDITFKKDIQPVDAPLNKLLSLNGVSYEWKTDEYKDKGFPEGRHYGVIAQEIEKVLPEVVNTAQDGTKSVVYTEIIPVLIEAMKAQQKEINELKALVGQLTGK